MDSAVLLSVSSEEFDSCNGILPHFFLRSSEELSLLVELSFLVDLSFLVEISFFLELSFLVKLPLSVELAPKVVKSWLSLLCDFCTCFIVKYRVVNDKRHIHTHTHTQ